MRQRKLLNNGFVKLDETAPKSVAFTFYIKAPMFLLNRFNETHLGTFKRIHKPTYEFYTPAIFQTQTGAPVENSICNELYTKFQNFHIWLYNFYRKLLEYKIHPQQLEMLLPQSLFVEFSLRLTIVEIQEFLNRYKGDSSYEVQQYVSAMYNLLVEHAPWTAEFLNDK